MDRSHYLLIGAIVVLVGVLTFLLVRGDDSSTEEQLRNLTAERDALQASVRDLSQRNGNLEGSLLQSQKEIAQAKTELGEQRKLVREYFRLTLGVQGSLDEVDAAANAWASAPFRESSQYVNEFDEAYARLETTSTEYRSFLSENRAALEALGFPAGAALTNLEEVKAERSATYDLVHGSS